MKIAFILDSFPNLSETFILNQITGLIDRGHEIQIYAKTGHFSNVHSDVENYKLIDKCRYHPRLPSNRLIRYFQYTKLIIYLIYHKFSTLSTVINTLRSGKAENALQLLYKGSVLLKDNNQDIIQCHYGTNGRIGAMLKKFGVKGKLVTMFHGYDIRIAQKNNGAIYSELFHWGDCFLSISDYNHKNLIRFGAPAQKLIYHPVGIDLNRFTFKWLESNKPFKPPVIILTVARLSEEKGLQYGIQAINKLLKKNPELSLEYRIIGDGIMEKQLKSQVKNLGLTKNVLFLGGMIQKEIIHEMKKAHIFLLPSIEEALPIVLMEAQASGLPSIASSAGSVSQIISDKNSGFIFQRKDVDGLVDKLTFLIERPESWKKMGAEGRKNIEEHYNINILNDRLVDIYNNLANNKQQTAKSSA